MTIREILDNYIATAEELSKAEEAVQKDKTTEFSPTEIYLFRDGVRRIEKCKAQAAVAKALREVLTAEQLDSQANMTYFIDFLNAKLLLLQLISKGS